jgi:hypothetical protein
MVADPRSLPAADATLCILLGHLNYFCFTKIN